MGSSDAGLDDLVADAIRAAGTPEGRRAVSIGAGSPIEALLVSLYPRLLGFATRLTLRRDLAEDVCQETMVKVIGGLSKFRPRKGRVTAGFEAWAFTIATNVYRDILRKSSRTVLLGDASAEENPLGGRVGSPPAEDLALDNIRNEAVTDTLRTLPFEQRAALVLRTYYDFSYREIGKATGCPEGTAKSRVHTAVVTLRNELKKRRLL